mmetsp:Transcript_26245/g.55810  ORF Transcript_26245/g.55810 Transcript_26245/m.55810 type:complete len:247 (+) Transcript_26245:30-770(+)
MHVEATHFSTSKILQYLIPPKKIYDFPYLPQPPSQALNASALAGSFFSRTSTSFILPVSTAPSVLSWLSSIIFTTRCHELSFSRSASMASSLSCSSLRFLAMRASLLFSLSAWKAATSSRAVSTWDALVAFSSSFRRRRVTAHSSFHLAMGVGSAGTSSPPEGTASSSSSLTVSTPSGAGGASYEVGSPRMMGASSEDTAGASGGGLKKSPSEEEAGGGLKKSASEPSAATTGGGLKKSPSLGAAA